MRMPAIVLGVIGALSAEVASAQVNYRFIKSGSSILGYASNSSDRAYNCSGVIAVNYEQYGQRGSASQAVTYQVRANSNDALVSQWQTPWAASTLNFAYNHQGCT